MTRRIRPTGPRARLAVAGVAGLLAISTAAPAMAMGSGDEYEDLQVGVTYTVYEPTFTAGLALQHFGGNTACPAGTEENALANYGKRSARQFTITQGNPMCSDIGEGGPVLTTTIGGAKATVSAYCPPSGGTWTCKRSDVLKYGGNLQVTLPAAAGLRPTTVWIETVGPKNVSAQQLVRIARGLEPVG